MDDGSEGRQSGQSRETVIKITGTTLKKSNEEKSSEVKLSIGYLLVICTIYLNEYSSLSDDNPLLISTFL